MTDQINPTDLTDLMWIQVKDGDPRAYALARRHYSFRPYRDGRRENPRYPNRHLFVGPGEKIVLLTPQSDALFVWKRFRSCTGEKVVHCALFRNESPIKSSNLILAAEVFARQRWPGETLYTYVNPRKVKSLNPGYCFLMAGWRKVGKTKSGLIIMAKEQV